MKMDQMKKVEVKWKFETQRWWPNEW